MKYIDLINRFWEIDIEARFSPTETKLYFAILHIANKLGWKQPLSIPNGRLLAMVGCTEATLIKARQRIKDLGLIDYKKGTTRKSGKYKINYLNDYFNNSSNDYSNEYSNQYSNRYSNQYSNHDSLYKTRQDKVSNKNSSNEEFSDERQASGFSLDELTQYEKEIVETWETIISPFQKEWLPDLKKVLEECYPAQIKNAIATLAKTKAEVMKEQGFVYVVQPLLNGAFGRRKKGGTAKRNNSADSKKDWLERFKNPAGRTITNDDLESIIYKPTGSGK